MTELFNRILLLKNSPLFEKVSTDDLRFVAQILEEEVYFEGDRVITIHEQGEHMYIIVEGKIGISILDDPEIKEFVDTLGPGGYFGEMNLLDDLPRSASVHVIEKCTLLSLNRTRLRALMNNYPELAVGMLQGLSLRLRESHDNIRKLKQQGN